MLPMLVLLGVQSQHGNTSLSQLTSSTKNIQAICADHQHYIASEVDNKQAKYFITQLANIQTLYKSLAQTALNKLSNHSRDYAEMLVNAFSMFAQCHNIYDLNFIDEARTHALEQSIEQFVKFCESIT
ncbi:hypothetical protein EMCRGX_G012932 [Ephydatia muelleri]